MPVTKGHKVPLRKYYAYNKYGTILYSSLDTSPPRWFIEQTIKYDDIVIYTGGYRLNCSQPFIKDFRVVRIVRNKEVVLCDLRDVVRNKRNNFI